MAEDQPFDPAEHNVEDVLAHVAGADEAETARIIAAEKAGKDRSTLLKQLEPEPEPDPPTPAVDPAGNGQGGADSDQTKRSRSGASRSRVYVVTAAVVQAKVGTQVLHFYKGAVLPDGVEKASLDHLVGLDFVAKV